MVIAVHCLQQQITVSLSLHYRLMQEDGVQEVGGDSMGGNGTGESKGIW